MNKTCPKCKNKIKLYKFYTRTFMQFNKVQCPNCKSSLKLIENKNFRNSIKVNIFIFIGFNVLFMSTLRLNLPNYVYFIAFLFTAFAMFKNTYRCLELKRC